VAKPVGTVHIAVAGGDGAFVHRAAVYPGDRLRVRLHSSQWALDLLRRQLLARSDSR
jgi:nicotinamide mononucleotide (NMN) deamidase PncC